MKLVNSDIHSSYMLSPRNITQIYTLSYKNFEYTYCAVYLARRMFKHSIYIDELLYDSYISPLTFTIDTIVYCKFP